MVAVIRIGNSDIDSVWDKAKPILERNFDADAIRAWLDDGSYQLWIEGEFRAVCTTSIDIYPDKKVCTVVHLAGNGLWEWVGDLTHIEGWAREQGCDRIRINGREEWSRVLPGYRKVAVVSEKEL
jgi:hypothetical protein